MSDRYSTEAVLTDIFLNISIYLHTLNLQRSLISFKKCKTLTGMLALQEMSLRQNHRLV